MLFDTALHPVFWRCVLHHRSERVDAKSLRLLRRRSAFLAVAATYAAPFLQPQVSAADLALTFTHHPKISYFQYHRTRTFALDAWVQQLGDREAIIFLGSGYDSRPASLLAQKRAVVAIDQVQRERITGFRNLKLDLNAECKKIIDQLPPSKWVMEGVSPYIGANTLLRLLEGSSCTGGWIDLYSQKFLKPLHFFCKNKLKPAFNTEEELHSLSAKFAKLGVEVMAFGDT